MSDLGWLLREQDGVITRRQAIAAGLTRIDVNRLIRRREWTAVHPGVYLNHNGPVSWLQRAWAAVLLYEPAGLCHQSALAAATNSWRSQPPLAPVHVAVFRARHLQPPRGVVVHRIARYDEMMEWNRHPPRIVIDHALLDVAADAPDELSAIGTLADACGARRTTPSRLLRALDDRPRLARRGWLRSVLLDLAEGTCSVLEHGYLTRTRPRSSVRTAPGTFPRCLAGPRLRGSPAGGRAGRASVSHLDEGSRPGPRTRS